MTLSIPTSLFFYQYTKFRDYIRQLFGVMLELEFLMKDAYSFDIDAAGMQRSYEAMHAAYMRIFTRLGLRFRAVQVDSGAIGGDASQEVHVLADSGEDAIAFSTGSDHAANNETELAALPGLLSAAGADLREPETPTKTPCEDYAPLQNSTARRSRRECQYGSTTT